MGITNLMVDNPIIFIAIIIAALVGILIILMIVLILKFKMDKNISRAALQLKVITESICAGVINFSIDDKFKIHYATNMFYHIFGYSKEGAILQGKTSLLDFIEPSNTRKFIDYFNNVKEKEINNIRIDLKMINKNTKFIYATITGQVSYDNKTLVSATVVETTDIILMQQQLEIDRQRYEIVAQLSNSLAFEYDITSDTVYFSDKSNDVFGMPAVIKNYLGDFHKSLKWIHEDDKGIYMEFINRIQESSSIVSQELRMLDKYGEYIWCQISCKAIVLDDIPIKAIGKISNINSFKNELRELEYKATRDPLTSVYNKETIQNKIERYIGSNRHKHHMLLFIDFDDFKHINDKFGHIIGDKVLVKVANRIRNTFLETGMIGRIGGDEFIVFIGDVQDEEDVNLKADTLLKLVNQEHKIDDHIIPVSISVGVAVYPISGNSYTKLLSKADEALYIAKKEGKQRYCINT